LNKSILPKLDFSIEHRGESGCFYYVNIQFFAVEKNSFSHTTFLKAKNGMK